MAIGQMTTLSATLSGKTGSTRATVVAPSLVSVTVTPANPSIGKLATKQFAATANYNDNTHPDVTNSATWTSSNTNVATVGDTANFNKGMASSSALNSGMTTI